MYRIPEETHVLVIGVVFRVTGEGGGEIGNRTRDYLQLLEVWAGGGRSRLFLHMRLAIRRVSKRWAKCQWAITGRRWAPHSHASPNAGKAGNVKMAGREGRHTDGLFSGGGMAIWIIPSGSSRMRTVCSWGPDGSTTGDDHDKDRGGG